MEGDVHGNCRYWKWVDEWAFKTKNKKEEAELNRVKDAEKGLCYACKNDDQCGGRWRRG